MRDKKHDTHLQKTSTELLQEKDMIISELQEKIYHLQLEIADLRGSKLVGRAIWTRHSLGRVINGSKRLVKGTLHKTRVVFAPVIPPALRKKVKGKYKKYRYGIQDKFEQATINNKAWKNAPLISVVVPFYNADETIDLTIDSVYAQSISSLEVILVDDCSPKKTVAKKLIDLKKKYINLTVVKKQKNEGVAEARNTGMKLARGKYIVCLDADDWIEPLYFEKAVAMLETDPGIDFVTPYTELFGVKTGTVKYAEYNPRELIDNNMVIHAAVTRRQLYDAGCRYKSGIGYEDWEYWIAAAERGFWGKTLPEVLFHYRTSIASRFIDDRSLHKTNTSAIRELHQDYEAKLNALYRKKTARKDLVSAETAFINLRDSAIKTQDKNKKEKVLVTLPWMTFGGAETLICNFTRELSSDYDITFVTGLLSEHEWEYRFKAISPKIYHLANLFHEEMYVEFISSYIERTNVSILHIVHNGFMFDMLEKLKNRHPKLKIILTMFNDRVEYFGQSIDYSKYIDCYSTDNSKVEKGYRKLLPAGAAVVRIPNGIDSEKAFNPLSYNRNVQRSVLDMKDDVLAVFFVGRLSEEKNPDVFVEVAENMQSQSVSVHFYMVGDGPMGKSLKERIKDLQNFTYIGYRPNEEVPGLLAAADVFVLPSAIEGFPLSLLEAMSMELAVIASDVGAVADVVEDKKDGYIVTPGSSIEIAAALRKLLKDQKLLNRIKTNARNAVEQKYSNSILGKNYKKLYKDVLK